MSTGNSAGGGNRGEVEARVREWLEWDGNAETRAEVERLRAASDWPTLERLLGRRLVFGTAGLRGRMGAGFACMNDLVIVQTSQGLAQYLLQTAGAVSKPPGVVIGYDGRHHSRRFAELTAAALRRAGLRVWLFGRLCPTPWVAFGVRHLCAAAGIMVTASHNPKHDNGYKVYWNNGAQILPPHDEYIQQAILKQLVPHRDAWNTQQVLSEVPDPLDDVTEAYLCTLAPLAPHPELHADSPLRFTATAMHGVSHRYLVKAFEACGLQPFVPVREQMEPDPEFPTIPFPNPEEGRSALQLAMNTADASGCPVVLATDPDADRLGVAERQTDGVWRILTGNETGALLGWWCWHSHQYRQSRVPPSACHVVTSTVSSKLLRALAVREGFHFHETLTGFKWMANKACDLEREGGTVLFAYEEAIGFMCGTQVLDKDGISAAVNVAQLATFLRRKHQQSLVDKLEELYDIYGHHVSNNSYYICQQPDVIRAIFERIRHWASGAGKSGSSAASYPKSLADGRFPISGVRDLTTGHDSSQPDQRALLPVSATTQMITWSFDNGCVLTLRTSGTEPKIKWYAELCGAPGQPAQRLREQLDQLVAAMQQEWLQPQQNALQARPV